MKTTNELIDTIAESGQYKIKLSITKLVVLGVLAGSYISFGSVFFTVVTAYGGHIGMIKLMGGFVFSLGLILVIMGRAELFTGNHLLIIPYLNKEIKLKNLLRNWVLIYIANFFGSLIIAGLVFFSEQYLQGENEIGLRALNIAHAKINFSFSAVFAKAVLCNILVCLAVWLAMVAKTFSGKVLGIIFPITAFVVMGFEHCVANMYFVPMGILIKNFAPHHFWSSLGVSPSMYSELNLLQFMTSNLIPVTLGNILGGSVFVGISYWFVHRDES